MRTEHEITQGYEAQIAMLKRQLRSARKAVRLAYKAEWMVTCDWTDNDERDAMWDEVKRLSGARF